MHRHESKRVEVFGTFALPVEVVAMARDRIVSGFASMGGRTALREGVTTENGGLLARLG